MTSVHELIRGSSASLAGGYSGAETPVRGHNLPSSYWLLVRASDGFETPNGLFRFFSVAKTVSRNDAEWVAAYGWLLDGFVSVAEDIFGDLYGYAFDGETCALTKVFCEGGERVACEPGDVVEFLRKRVFSDSPSAFDSRLAHEALSAGLRPDNGEHLAFALPLIAGGSPSVENLTVEPVELHLGVLAQLSLTNSATPDGTPITAVVANEGQTVLMSAGDCPVCADSGAVLLVLVHRDDRPIFVCPLCECSWDRPPRGVDEIVGIADRAPGGVRFPTSREIRDLREQHKGLTEVERSDWEGLLSEHVRVR